MVSPVKQKIKHLKRGDHIEGRITEIQPDSNLLIYFEGDLLRVENKTHQIFKVGQVISLYVTTVHPLSFRLLSQNQSHIDISV